MPQKMIITKKPTNPKRKIEPVKPKIPTRFQPPSQPPNTYHDVTMQPVTPKSTPLSKKKKRR
jgi:hypothetical protein